MTVVLLSSDLTVVSRVEGAAARAGMTLCAVSSAAEAVECCIAERAETLIVDLTTPSLDVNALVAEGQDGAEPIRIIAFGPHVHEERLAAAREAGCDDVVSRGQFFARLDTILAR